MTSELKKLIAQWREERTYRDGGEAAKRTFKKIEKIATPQQVIKLLKECS